MEIDLKNLTPKVRLLSDIKNVVFDQTWLESASERELYFMYGNVAQNDDLWYSITVIPPNMLGKEFVKTKGHSHIGGFQEIYNVIEGEAIYLFQKTNGPTVEDVYAVKAKRGDSVIIRSGYGHVTINASNMELKTGDWRFEGIKADYSLFEKLRGACYYYTTEGWIKNENYKSVPKLRFEEPLKSVPENLDFLRIG